MHNDRDISLLAKMIRLAQSMGLDVIQAEINEAISGIDITYSVELTPCLHQGPVNSQVACMDGQST